MQCDYTAVYSRIQPCFTRREVLGIVIGIVMVDYI
jgi:hypothetical protein